MGKVTKGDSQNFSGKIGNKIYQKRKNGTTVVYEAPAIPSTPQRSEAQLSQRLQFANLAAVNTQFHKTLKKGFEDIGNSMSDYNAFVQCNANVVKVYVPKQVRLNGGCVLAPYQITRGKLPSIDYAKNGNGVLVSDINMGAYVIGDATTIAQFSAAILAYNEDWAEGDQLTYFYGIQTIDNVTHIPRARINGYKVVLDLKDDTLLYDVVTGLGFTSVGGKLGMNMVIEEGAAAWIHSRENENNGLSVSTQYLYVDSSVLEAYQTNEAFTISADSYGGVNKQEPFLKPKSNTVRATQSLPEVPANGGTSGSGTGSGSETPTVAAPQITGTTPFEESTQVTITGPSEAEIRYTTDGSTPTAESTQYTEPLTLTASTTVKAIAVKDEVSSSVTTKVFTKGSTGGNESE